MPTKVSEHFSLEEFSRSDTAVRLGIDNTPTPEHIVNIKLLCENVLEPIRNHFKKPVRLNSGYRSMALNMAVNPMTSTINKLSKHCLGQAADIEIEGVSNYDLAVWCRDNLPIYHQVILEFYTPGQPNSGWVHVSFVKDNQKKEVLTAHRVKGKLTYSIGLIQ